jgi:hypothetical protein
MGRCRVFLQDLEISFDECLVDCQRARRERIEQVDRVRELVSHSHYHFTRGVINIVCTCFAEIQISMRLLYMRCPKRHSIPAQTSHGLCL